MKISTAVEYKMDWLRTQREKWHYPFSFKACHQFPVVGEKYGGCGIMMKNKS